METKQQEQKKRFKSGGMIVIICGVALAAADLIGGMIRAIREQDYAMPAWLIYIAFLVFAFLLVGLGIRLQYIENKKSDEADAAAQEGETNPCYLDS